MKFCSWGKDGGHESTVWGFWFIEIKSLFSIVLLKMEDGTRDVYHNHAFNAVSWILKGLLCERHLDGSWVRHMPSIKPVITRRDTFHKVQSYGTTWALSFRGPWSKTWQEYHPKTNEEITLAHGRKVV